MYRDDVPAEDIVRRFEIWIREPVAAIAVLTGVVLTAITWITTFLVTVSSVAAYLGQNVSTASAEELVFNTRAAASSAGEARAAIDSKRMNSAADDPVATSSGIPQITTTGPVPNVTARPEALVEYSTPALPLTSQITDFGTESATPATSRVAQHQGASGEQSKAVENGPAHAQSAQSHCDEGFWGSICKERMRWNYCHPDKWDMHAQCVVQAFDLSYSLN
jgi:hypothetical protein